MWIGGYVDVLTLDGMIEMKVPPYLQADSTLLLRNKGVGGGGDHFVHVKIKLPSKLTSKQTQLMEEFKREEEENKSSSNNNSTNNSENSVSKAWNRLKHLFS